MEHLIATTDEIGSALHYHDATRTDSKVLMLVRRDPLDSELTEADSVPCAIRHHLGANAFASNDCPYGKGLVPAFNFDRQ